MVRTTSDRKRLVAAAALALLLVAAACSSTTSGGSTGVTANLPGTTASAAAVPRFAEPGPYAAGTTTLDLDGRKLEVWYPADAAAVAGKPKVIFEIRDLIPDALKQMVPDDLNPRYETNAYRDVTASPMGPFPLVLFAHGFAAYPTEYQHLLTHLASWGMVVAAPDFKERGLLASLTGAVSTVDETAVMEAARLRMAAENQRAGGPLAGVVDAANVGTVGHSAGVRPALGEAAASPEVKTFVAMSGGFFRGGGSGTTGTTVAPPPVPDKPGMVVTGGKDQVAELPSVQALFDAMVTPKRLVVVDEAGHNSFNDLCLIGADQGGLLTIAGKVGIPVPDNLSGLFNDGCTAGYLAAAQVWPVTRQFVTAQLRYELGLDPEPLGLQPAMADAFGPVQVTYTVA